MSTISNLEILTIWVVWVSAFSHILGRLGDRAARANQASYSFQPSPMRKKSFIERGLASISKARRVFCLS